MPSEGIDLIGLCIETMGMRIQRAQIAARSAGQALLAVGLLLGTVAAAPPAQDGAPPPWRVPDTGSDGSAAEPASVNGTDESPLLPAATAFDVRAAERITPLLLPGPNDDEPVLDDADSTVVRSRYVRINEAGVAAIERKESVRLNLFPDVTCAARFNSVERRSPSSFVASGSLAERSPSWVTLVHHDGVTVANIRDPSRGVFQIRLSPDGRPIVREIDESKFPPCGTGPADDLLPRAQPMPMPNVAGGCADDGEMIDMLVVYTPSARNAAGGTPAMIALINLAEAETNSAYLFSQITPRIRVVATHEVDYQESGNSQTDRERLILAHDGYMDEVHELRDNLRADVVSMIVHVLEVCGRASFSVQAGPTAYPDYAFNVVLDGCATGNFTFGHELGHNQGCRHDRTADNSDLGAFLYAHGYRDTAHAFRTIMAVFTGGVPRVPFFSNPNLLYNNAPMGISEGMPDSADNAQAINLTALLVANFRNSDCNYNGICDDDEIAGGLAIDCNHNGRPDECEADCNHNGRLDSCDIDLGDSDDCGNNGIPDECEPDCNNNGRVDTCDIVLGLVSDNNDNGVPDTCEPPVLYVDANAVGHNTGITWADALRDLQPALAAAEAGMGAVHEVWVAAGTYTPTDTIGNRSATFRLVNSVGVYGGFGGWETQREQRDPRLHETILSGDLLFDDGPQFTNRGDNSYNVIIADNVNSTAVLDGFTVSGGKGDAAFPHNVGAGLYSNNSSARVANCVFRDNDVGGTTILGHGGAISVSGGLPTFTNCTFIGNRASASGGVATNNLGTEIGYFNCRFLGNRAGSDGTVRAGGLNGADVTMVGCLFSGNVVNGKGGAIYAFPDATVRVSNCTFSANHAPLGAGGFWGEPGNSLFLTNSILWGNTTNGGGGQSAQLSVGTISPNYSIIQGWNNVFGGMSNSGADPLFADPDGADNLLGTLDDNPRPRPGSPAIDSGINTAVPLDDGDVDSDGDVFERLPLDVDRKPRFYDEPQTPNTGAGSPPYVDRGAVESTRDCNTNGVLDETEAALGISEDCNGNLRPDECEPNDDCDNNGVQDICDAANGLDCNHNGIPDSCDLVAGLAIDCNQNALPDECDVAAGTSLDCNQNAAPDECDFADGTSKDCNHSGVPDECEPLTDCDNDGRQDVCQIAAFPRLDCNLNGLLDKCESQEDCNDNGQLDICDVARHTSRDCDDNGIPDECDIASGTYPDLDENKVPDPCQFPRPVVATAGCRYLWITPAAHTGQVALRLDGNPNDPRVACVTAYVQADGTLGDNAVFRDADEWGTVAVADAETMPLSSWLVMSDYGTVEQPRLSLPASGGTWRWGDLNGSGGLDLDDLLCIQAALGGDFSHCTRYGADLVGQTPNRVVDVNDLLAFLGAIAGQPYPYPPPCP